MPRFHWLQAVLYRKGAGGGLMGLLVESDERTHLNRLMVRQIALFEATLFPDVMNAFAYTSANYAFLAEIGTPFH